MSSDADRVRRRMSISHLIHQNSAENEHDSAAVRRSASHETRFHCEECSRSFTGRAEFLQHRAGDGRQSHKESPRNHALAAHENGAPFKCELCHSTFRTKTHLQAHISHHHEKKKPFSCGECGMSFGLKWNLKSHVQRVHEGSRPFACSLCSMSFAKKYDLNRHTRLIHEKEQSYKCNACKRSFSTRSDLQTHMNRSHRGRRNSLKPPEEA